MASFVSWELLEVGCGLRPVKTFASPGVVKGEAIAASALDAAFESLSVEQRIAVKMEMMRGGLLA